MARSLASKQNVDAPNSANFEFGRIKDRIDGVQEGTPLNEPVYGDFHQFFEKILSDAGITANGQPENKVNGYQYNDALKGVWVTPPSLTSPYVADVSNPFIYAKNAFGCLKIRGTINVPSTPSANGVFVLPVGFRPAGLSIVQVIYVNGTTVSLGYASILNGQISLNVIPSSGTVVNIPEQHITL